MNQKQKLYLKTITCNQHRQKLKTELKASNKAQKIKDSRGFLDDFCKVISHPLFLKMRKH
jgi:hypothetical protein